MGGRGTGGRRLLALLRKLQWVATRGEDLGYPLSPTASKEVALRVQVSERRQRLVPLLCWCSVFAFSDTLRLFACYRLFPRRSRAC